MANILNTIRELFQASIKPDGSPPPPAILQDIGDRLLPLMDISVDPTGAGIERWLTKLREITNNKELHESLLVRALQMHLTRAAEFLTLLGVIGINWNLEEPNKVTSFFIDWDRLNDIINKPEVVALQIPLTKVPAIEDIKALQVLIVLLISSPQELLELEYMGQGFSGMPVSDVPGVNSDQLLGLIDELVNSPVKLQLPFKVPLNIQEVIENVRSLVPGDLGTLILNGPDSEADFNDLAGFSIEVNLLNAAAELKPIDLGDDWKLRFSSSGTGNQTFKLHFTANGIDTSFPSTSRFAMFLSKTRFEENALLIGEENGTHFSVRSIELGLGLNTTAPIFDFRINFSKIEFALKPDFLKFLSFGLNLPTLLSFNSDVAIKYVQGKGFTAQGNGENPSIRFEFATPLNLKIGGNGASISVDQVVTHLEVMLLGSKLLFLTSFRYGATAEVGPLKIIMDGAGVSIGRWTDSNGGLLKPTGIGISLDAGPINGGGFLNIIGDNDFAGALQLKILGIGAYAYGLYKVMANGDISFVVLIGIRLPPPGIQIGFGFAISGFGGLVGINRRADNDIIRERLATGSAGDVLFNDNPMNNAPKLLGDMRLFFPDEPGSFLIGPTLQINWLYIIKLDVGVFIQLPAFKIIFAGTAKLIIGSEEFALVYLRMDFMGIIDTTKSLITFDAVLVNSHVLGIFRITGGVALRISYGENGYFLFSVGGFHPAFNPGSMELPKVPRVGVSYSLGPVWLKKEMYLAITSNTFQLGSKIEAGIEIGPISAHGWFAFDALIQFKPFYFIGQINAGFDVEVEGVSLCNVHVQGMLSGPGPLILQARASVRVLFLKVSDDVTIELCNNPPEQLTTIPSIPAYLKEKGELDKPENIRAEGEDASVIFLKPVKVEKELLLAPVGGIIWEQKRVPLNLPIQKLEGVDLGGWRIAVASIDKLPYTDEEDWFSVGTYLNLSDGEALNSPKFARQPSGIRVGTEAVIKAAEVPGNLGISLFKLPKRSRFLDENGKEHVFGIGQYINNGLSGVLRDRSSEVKLNPGKAIVTVKQELWNLHGADGKVLNEKLNSTQAFVNAKRTGGIALPAVEKQLNLTGII